MNKPAKPRADWEAIERLYRADVLSIREIAAQHGISEGAIRKRAKAEGWERDLGDKVAAKVRNELVRTEVRTKAPMSAGTQKEIVDEAAAIQVAIVREHRTSIKSGKEIVELLMHQLRDAIGARAAIEVFIEDQTKADDDNMKRYNALMKAVSIPTHTAAVVNLANALKTFIGLDRQAFGLSDEVLTPKDPLAALIERVQNKGNRLPIRAEQINSPVENS